MICVCFISRFFLVWSCQTSNLPKRWSLRRCVTCWCSSCTAARCSRLRFPSPTSWTVRTGTRYDALRKSVLNDVRCVWWYWRPAAALAVTLTASSCGHVIVSVIGRGGCCARRQRSWGTGPPRRLTRPRAARGHGSTATSAVWSRPGRRSPTRLTCTASRSPTETRSESAGWEPVTASCAWWTEYGLMHVSELLE